MFFGRLVYVRLGPAEKKIRDDGDWALFFVSAGAMDVTKPYEFIGFGAMDVTKPYEFIGFGGWMIMYTEKVVMRHVT
jgi:hypothetical protein